MTVVLATILLELANIQQLIEVWTKHSSLGHSIGGWLCVNAALLLWINYYRVKQLKVAMWSTLGGWVLNTSLILSVIYWKN